MLVYFGLAIVMTSIWVLLLLIPVLVDLAARRGRAGGGLSRAALRRGLPQIPGPRAALARERLKYPSSSGLANSARSWMN